ncbi:MAG TPA: methyltransferase domain-containing protein [Burkholderiaceae bacterium]|nr:methyltransferase domain-containing protein [Burkholderiaceae bacterium]
MPTGDPLVTPQGEFHDAAALRLRARLARAAEPPWLHGEVARRMADRLPIIRQPPQRWLDWWAHVGGGATTVRAAYPQSQRTAVEPDGALRARSVGPMPPWWSRRRWGSQGDTVLLEGGVAPASADMVWANMMLHTCADITSVFAAWHRALAADGFLMFSTLGPGTLAELRLLYERERWGPAFYPFADMHDLGDALVHAGFADPVMDQEMLTLTWSSPQAALQELRALGSNLHARRHRGLRTPRWRDRLLQHLERRRDADGRVALGFEIVYGHAVRPRARARVAPVAAVPLQDLRADLARQRSIG